MKRSRGWMLLAALGLLTCLVVYSLVASPLSAPVESVADKASVTPISAPMAEIGGEVGPQATTTDVGVAPLGHTAMEFTARIDQDGGVFEIYGYVTYLHDLEPELLFTDPISRTEATARITMSGTAFLTARSVLSNVFNVDAEGIVSFYYDEDDGANFDDLESFGRGANIGAAVVHLQNILTVTGPNTGIANGNGEFIHTMATPFDLNGVEYRLGRPGMIERVTFAGGGIRIEPDPPVAIIAVGGSGTVAGFDTSVPLVKK